MPGLEEKEIPRDLEIPVGWLGIPALLQVSEEALLCSAPDGVCWPG